MLPLHVMQLTISTQKEKDNQCVCKIIISNLIYLFSVLRLKLLSVKTLN